MNRIVEIINKGHMNIFEKYPGPWEVNLVNNYVEGIDNERRMYHV